MVGDDRQVLIELTIVKDAVKRTILWCVNKIQLEDVQIPMWLV